MSTTPTPTALPIPIGAARLVAEQFGYDQVVIVARKTGDSGGEHVTTYGIDEQHCAIAARIGDFLKVKVMGWVAKGGDHHDALVKALRDCETVMLIVEPRSNKREYLEAFRAARAILAAIDKE